MKKDREAYYKMLREMPTSTRRKAEQIMDMLDSSAEKYQQRLKREEFYRGLKANWAETSEKVRQITTISEIPQDD